MQRLSAVMPRRTVGGALVGLAILYFALETLLIVATLASRALLDPLMHTAWIIDLTVQCRALLVGGVLLWRRETLGYVVGAGLLLQFGVLNVGYLVVVVLQAFFAAAPINAPVVALLLVTGVICFTPLTFFVRGGARR